jgi:hypothetical protein
LLFYLISSYFLFKELKFISISSFFCILHFISSPNLTIFSFKLNIVLFKHIFSSDNIFISLLFLFIVSFIVLISSFKIVLLLDFVLICPIKSSFSDLNSFYLFNNSSKDLFYSSCFFLNLSIFSFNVLFSLSFYSAYDFNFLDSLNFKLNSFTSSYNFSITEFLLFIVSNNLLFFVSKFNFVFENEYQNTENTKLNLETKNNKLLDTIKSKNSVIEKL